MESLLQDIRFAARQIGRAPWFSATIVLVMALGIGITSATLSYVRGVLTIPAPGVNRDSRLVSAAILDAESRRRFGRFSIARVTYPTFTRLHKNLRGFESFAAQSYPRRYSADFGAGPEAVNITGVTAAFFPTLRLSPAVGAFLHQSREDAADAERVVVIDHRLWQIRFGRAANVVGRTIRISGTPFTIVGVAPEEFVGLSSGGRRGYTMWMPLAATHALAGTGVMDSLEVHLLLGRIADGVSYESAAASLGGIAAQTMRSGDSTRATISAWVDRMRLGRYTPGTRDGDVVSIGFMLSAISILVLIITCTNASALLLGKGASRSHEVAVRYSLGAGRGRIVRQLLTESVCLALAAALLGLGVLRLIQQSVFAWTANDTPILLPVDWLTVMLSLGAAVATGILFGISPALHASRASIAETMKQGASSSDWRRTRAQRGMIIAQLAVSQPVLLAMMLALGSVASQRPWDTSFAGADRVIGIGLDFDARRYSRTAVAGLQASLRDRIVAIPGVARAEFAERVPGVFDDLAPGQMMLELEPEPMAGFPGPVGSRRGSSEIHTVGIDYFATVGLPVVRGRDFEWSDTLPPHRNVILPEEVAASFWPGQDPIGKRLIPGTVPFENGGSRRIARGDPVDPYTVVGVAASQRTSVPSVRPSAYLAGGASSRANIMLMVRTNGPALPLFPAIQREIKRLDADLPIAEFATLQQAERRAAGFVGRIAAAASSFAFLSLTLVSVGLAGIVMFAVAQRTREIGVRMALGARGTQIMGLFVRQGVRTALLGFLIGAPLSALVFILAMRSSFRASLSLNSLSAVVAAFVLFGVVLLASWLPARRAARTDPVVALRSE